MRFDYIEIYQDSEDKWRWRGKAKNGNVLADSGQGYSRAANLHKMLINRHADDSHITPIKILTSSNHWWPLFVGRKEMRREGVFAPNSHMMPAILVLDRENMIMESLYGYTFNEVVELCRTYELNSDDILTVIQSDCAYVIIDLQRYRESKKVAKNT